MNGRGSIQRALIVRLLGALLAVLIGTSVGLFFLVRQVLERQFDDALVSKARLLSAFVKRDEEGRLEMELEEAQMPEFERARGAEYFAVRDGGSMLFASPSLAGRALPAASDRSAGAVSSRDDVLPDGRRGRIVWLPFVPYSEEGGSPSRVAGAGTTSRPLIMQIARERESLDARLRDLSAAVGLMALVLLIAIPVVVARVIPRNLRPLDDLARRAATIDAQSLDLRFPAEGLPSELAAITARLNELLERLSASFQRERRFTADVAHELRTPIAELRALAEVALAGPGEPNRETVVLQDARDIALQMERLVTSLLALSRFQSGHQPVKRELVEVAAAISRVWSPLEGIARQRRLRIDLGDGVTGQVAADPALFDSVLRNLLENATTYTPEGGRVAISTAREGDTTTITVANTSGDLDETDRPHLFEPFWRKDAARTDGFHSGLGLALVASMVRLMGGVVSAYLTPDGWVRFVVRLPSTPLVDVPGAGGRSVA